MTAGTIKFPARACTFRLEEDALQLAAAGDGKAAFTMVANSGKPILGHWYWGNLGIDLSGVKCSKRMPALVDHDPGQRVGFTTGTELSDRGLVVSGQFLARSDLAQQVRAESQDGFPWQASVHLRPNKIERIPDGAEIELNGYPLKGPATVFRTSECREVSFTALGADPETSASALSAGTEPAELEANLLTSETMTTKTEPAAQPPAVPDLAAARAESSAAALTAERNRVTAILAAAGPDHAELAQKLIADGTAIEPAVLAINQAMRASLTALQGKLAAAAPKSDAPLSLGNKGTETATKTPLQLAQEMTDGPDKWAKLYELDPEIRAEFSSAKAFAAFKAAPACR